MRTPRSLLKADAPQQRKRRRKTGQRISCADVLWWASINQREPFITAARKVKQAGSRADYVLWQDNNEMEVITK